MCERWGVLGGGDSMSHGRCVIPIENWKFYTKVVKRLRKDKINFSEEVRETSYSFGTNWESWKEPLRVETVTTECFVITW